MNTGPRRRKQHTHVPAQIPTSGKCKIAFVGEAPGDDEMWEGVPFVGPSGQIFNQLLRTANIHRSECYVGNVFDTQLPDNNVENWCGTTAEAKEWRKDGYDLTSIARGKWLRPEFVDHLVRLERELADVQPTVVVPMGGTALWAFTGTSGIMARRGAVAEACVHSQGTKLVPTFHPAFLLHSYKMFSVVVMDLLKAVNESTTPEITTTPRELWLEPTIDDIYEFKKAYLDNAPYISVDIETIPSFRHITAIGFSGGPHYGISIPFVDRRKPDRSYWPDASTELAGWAVIDEILRLPQPKLGQNYTYDAQWMWTLMGLPSINYSEDTRLIHHALYPELPKDLGFLGACYARETAWKTMRHNKAEKRDE